MHCLPFTSSQGRGLADILDAMELGVSSQLACLARKQPLTSQPMQATPHAPPSQQHLAAAPETRAVHQVPNPPSTIQPVGEPQPTHSQQHAGTASATQGPQPDGACDASSLSAGASRAPVSVSSEVQDATAQHAVPGGSDVLAAMQPTIHVNSMSQTAGAPRLCGQGTARLQYTSAVLLSLGKQSLNVGAAAAGILDAICAAGVEMTQRKPAS